MSLADQMHLSGMPIESSTAALPDLLTLAGRRVLVTGGGGPNLGSACVERLASLGADVAVVDLDPEAARVVAEQVAERWGTTVLAFAGDTSDRADIERFVAEVEDSLGPLDAVVHSAGGGGSASLFLEKSAQEIESDGRFNFLGSVHVAHVVLARMVARGSGRLILVTSATGETGLPQSSVYGASKAGAIGLTRLLAREIGGTGVTVNSVSPGVIVNEPMAQALAGMDAADEGSVLVEAIRRTKLGRPGWPQEIANVVAFLATDAASYVHGATIQVGGGLSE